MVLVLLKNRIFSRFTTISITLLFFVLLVYAAPLIDYVSPTPNNATTTSSNYVEVNITVTESDLDLFIFNWDDTNYSIYNDSLLLMMNFENLSSLGESNTHVFDISNNGNNGTVSGAVWNSTGGVLGRGAYEFDGSDNQRITVAGFEKGPYVTIGFWIKFKSFPSGNYENLVGGGEGSHDGCWMIYRVVDSQTIRVHAKTTAATGWHAMDSQTTFNTDEWYHIVETTNGTAMRLYVNGVEDGNSPVAIDVPSCAHSANQFFIGDDLRSGTTAPNATIDEVRFYNWSFTSNEVKQLYYSKLEKLNATNWEFYSNLTNLSDGTYTYRAFAINSTGGLNQTELRTVTVDTPNPLISFESPTLANGTTTSNTTVEVNVSLTEDNLDEFKFNWAGTNYSFYDDGLYTLFNFENVSALGDNSTLATDASTYGNDGALMNGAAWTTDGRYGNALFLDGTDDYVTLDSTTVTNYTVSFWFNNTNSSGTLFHRGNSAGGCVYEPIISVNGADSVSASVSGCASSGSVGSGTVIANDWNHVAFSVNTNTQTLYLNGAQAAQASLSSMFVGAKDSFIGVLRADDSGTPASNYVNTTIDEFYLFNRSLSSDEISMLYNATLRRLDTNVWDFFANQTGLSDGAYNFQAFATDGQNNYNSTESRIITIDTSPPSISFTAPTPDNGTTTANTSVEINVSITESNLSEFKFNWNGTNYSIYNDSLVLMYNFDNVSAIGDNNTNAFDISNSGYNGSLINGPIWTTSGKYGGALTFDGTDDYVNIPDSGSLNITTPVTYSLWAKTAGSLDITGSQGMMLMGRGTVGDPRNSMYIYINHTEKAMFWYEYSGGTDSNRPTSTTNVADGNWHFIVGGWNGTHCLIYVDGQLEDSTDCTNTPGPFDEDFFVVGKSLYATQEYFKGTIDEARVYNRSLSSAEISQMYKSNLKKLDSDSWEFYSNQSSLNDGTHTYQAFATDGVGNFNSTEMRTLTIDTNKPNSIVTNLTNAQLLNVSTFTIKLNSSDTNLANIWYSVDGGVNSTPISSNGTGSVSSLADGSHYLVIWANDTATNINFTNISFIVDTSAPKIFTNVSNGATLTASTFTLKLNASDPNFNRIWYSLNGGANSTPSTSNTTTAISGLSDGSHYVVIYANDSLTNLNTTNISFTIDVGTPPVLTIVSPTPANDTFRENNWAFMNITSNEALSSAWVEQWNTSSGSNTTMSGTSTNKYVNLTNLTEGVYYFRIWANDTNGNINNTESRIFKRVTVANSTTVNVTANTTTVIVNETEITILGSSNTSNSTISINTTVTSANIGGYETMNSSNSGGAAEQAVKYLIADNSTSLANLSNLTLRLSYTAQEIAGLDEDSLGLYYWNGSRWFNTIAYINSGRIPGGPKVYSAGRDKNNKFVYAVVDHLSTWSLGGSAPTSGGTTADTGTTAHSITISDVSIRDEVIPGSTIRLLVTIVSNVYESGTLLTGLNVPTGWTISDVQTGSLQPGKNVVEVLAIISEDATGEVSLGLELIPRDFIGTITKTINLIVGGETITNIEGIESPVTSSPMGAQVPVMTEVPQEPESTEVPIGVYPEDEEKKGICGPSLIVLFALLPVIARRRIQ